MPRMTIYVPDELKTQMDQAADRNWSALAQEAFDAELRRLEWQAKLVKEIDMDSVAERLRESKTQYDAGEKEAGFSDGARWASTHAEYIELKRAVECELRGEHDAYNRGQHDAYNFAIQVLGGENEADLRDVQDFWDVDNKQVFEYPSDEYVAAFQNGAISVWEKVADKL